MVNLLFAIFELWTHLSQCVYQKYGFEYHSSKQNVNDRSVCCHWQWVWTEKKDHLFGVRLWLIQLVVDIFFFLEIHLKNAMVLAYKYVWTGKKRRRRLPNDEWQVQKNDIREKKKKKTIFTLALKLNHTLEKWCIKKIQAKMNRRKIIFFFSFTISPKIYMHCLHCLHCTSRKRQKNDEYKIKI